MRGRISIGLERRPEDPSGDARPRRSRPRGQRRPEWVQHRERSSRAGLRVIVWVALTLGRPAARALLYPICLYLVIFSPASRAASTDYLRRALPRAPGLADTFRHCHTFAATLLDRVFLLNGQYSRFDVRLHGEEILADLKARNQGCFLLGAHMGSFEVIRAMGLKQAQARVSLVMYEDHAAKFHAALAAVNPALRMQVIALGKIDAMLKVETALNRGEFVGLLGDRTFHGEGTLVCPFLGTPAHFPSGPFRLAAMLKRPVVLMFGLYRGGNRYDIHVERLVDTWETPGIPPDARLDRALREYVARLEHHCREAPYNWYNFHDFWA